MRSCPFWILVFRELLTGSWKLLNICHLNSHHLRSHKKFVVTTLFQRATVSNFKSSKSALAEHVCETSHNIAWGDSRIITTNNRYGQLLEAWHINATPCALNRDDRSHLAQEYLHLVAR